jgi:signal transduction histidine kinase
MRPIAIARALPSERLRHELRTELTVIRGYAQLAQRQLVAGRPIDRVQMRRALVAIEQASRALDAWIALGTDDRR